MAPAPATVHASAVLVGARAVLVRGPAGSGKSRLVLRLIEAAASGRVRFARMVADDRVLLTPCHGRLLAQAPKEIEGRQALFVVNLAPKTMAGETSEGMMFDVGYADGLLPVMAVPEKPIPNGARVG